MNQLPFKLTSDKIVRVFTLFFEVYYLGEWDENFPQINMGVD